MSRQQNSPISVVTGAVVNAFRRIYMSGSTCIQAPATAIGFGVSQAYTASGGACPVRGYGEGTCKCTAATAFSAGDNVYPAADGKISGTAVAAGPCGVALEAATADGDIVEFVPSLIGKLTT